MYLRHLIFLPSNFLLTIDSIYKTILKDEYIYFLFSKYILEKIKINEYERLVWHITNARQVLSIMSQKNIDIVKTRCLLSYTKIVKRFLFF